MLARVSVVSFLIAAGACTARESTPAAGEPVQNAAAEPLPVTRLKTEPYTFTYSSGFERSARLVIRDSAAWRMAWDTVHIRSSPMPLPAVDFSKEMIVVAALGLRNAGGYSIYVDSASESASGIEVVIRSVSPGKTCGVTAALTQPVDIARLPRREGAVRFAERSEVSECP
jgi:hypothetical protein